MSTVGDIYFERIITNKPWVDINWIYNQYFRMHLAKKSLAEKRRLVAQEAHIAGGLFMLNEYF